MLEVLGGALTAKPYWVKTTFGILGDLLPQNSISKSRRHIEQAGLSLVNALCKSTHTLDQLVTTPRVTESDAPNICICLCVLCVGGARSNDETLFSQHIPNKYPTVPPGQKNTSPKSVTYKSVRRCISAKKYPYRSRGLEFIQERIVIM